MNATLVLAFFLLLIVLVFGSAAVASISAAPWLPIRKKDHDRILKAFTKRSGNFVDLGAGDGRVLTLIASHTPLVCCGYEVSALPYIAAWIRLRFSSSGKHAQIIAKNFFTIPFGETKNFFCFLTPMAMKKLKEKFERECTPGTRIVSYSFSIPGWTPVSVDRSGTGIPLYTYDR